MNRGILISFEGGEGSGKSVQVKRLAKYLRQQKNLPAGRQVVITREPGGTKISEQIREIILDKKNKRMAFETEALLFQAARAQVCEEIILPALMAGKIVIADRFRDSSVVYQGIVRGLGVKYIELLNEISTKKTKPKITFLLDLPAEVGLARRNNTNKNDRLDGENLKFHRRIRQAYLAWAKQNSRRFVVINASQNPTAIHREILEVLKKSLLGGVEAATSTPARCDDRQSFQLD